MAVTKLVKQVVSESDEEDEEDPIPKAVKGQAKHGGAAKKPAAQGEKKQQSLLSFFGKKWPWHTRLVLKFRGKIFDIMILPTCLLIFEACFVFLVL